jgi:hypothetical protein
LAEEDNDGIRIPRTPTVVYAGTEGYPVNDLWFATSPFSDPQGSGTFAAMKWRIAEYDLNHSAGPVDEIVLLEPARDWRYFKGTAEPSDPVEAWREPGFDDDNWPVGQTPIGFGDDDDNTDLSLEDPPMRNNYTSVYLRNTFDITDRDELQTLKLHVYVDDGCIVWINGVEVARMYCGDGDMAYNGLTNVTHHEASSYEEVLLAGSYDYLVNGTNVIAVHALQATTGSSDFSIDVSVSMSNQETIVPALGPSKYEIDPGWESEELTDPDNLLIQIPASEVEPGRVYRVRSRMKDNTGRWSHWSDPVEFVAGDSAGADILDYLRVAELMYNPSDDWSGTYDSDEFEFIELKNISTTTTLDLSTTSITDGVGFSFANSQVTYLGPGECVLVVSNLTAFTSRYGHTPSNRIAGVYDGNLSNSGEHVEIFDAWNGTVASFTYDDDGDWPQSADGDGDSLVPKSWWTLAELQAGILDDPNSWQASAPTPGQ